MSFETIIFDVSGGIARLTLNRPDRLNAFTVQMHEEVRAALEQVQADASVRTLVLSGAGRGFCAGQDLGDRAVSPDAPVDLGDSVDKYYAPLIKTLTGLEMPVIGAVNGVAAGAGASIALAADIVIASDKAKFVQSFASIGLVPDSGGTWVLPRTVGMARAMGMALTGDPISAKQAEEWGLIWKCVAAESFEAEVSSLAERFAKAPTRGLVRTKQAIRSSFQRDLSDQLELERDFMRELGKTHDYREGVDAFMNKRKPNFEGK